ncbi:HNH endonuclease [Aquirufa echingensis]|jgi:hypothetical protein|uniref:NUMOD4 domain-containing protein n=1 Tax=Aquirufa echingensis TaxID=3096516 RepID=A0ABW6D412_9BACT
MLPPSPWTEKWAFIKLPIPTDQTYQISNFGRIRNRNQKILQGSSIQGYRTLNIRIGSEHVNFYIHKLVALHFVSLKSTENQFVIHKDYDKLNNIAENLQWVTRAELTEHNKRNPANINKRKPLTGRHYKLNPGKVKIIKQMLLSGKSRPKMIAKQFGITSTQVTRIKKGENWKHVS